MKKIDLKRLKKKVVGSVKKGTKKTLSGVNKAFSRAGVSTPRKKSKKSGATKAKKATKRKKAKRASHEQVGING